MDSIKSDLTKRLSQRSLATTATAAYVCHVANQQASGRYMAVSFRNGTLTLAAPTAGAAQNLRFDQTQILDQIRRSVSQPVGRLRIVVRPRS